EAGYCYLGGVYELNHSRSLFSLHFYLPSQSSLTHTFLLCVPLFFLPRFLFSCSSALVSWPLLLCLLPLCHPERSDRDFNGLLSSLVQLLSAPGARTLLGFQSLVQREWVAAGHPFLTRLGVTGASEEAPVFLLFLDCVWQLLQQFPAEFEFSEFFLLALHDSARVPDTLTFLRNTPWERGKQSGQFNSYTQICTPGYSQPLAGNSVNPQLSVWDWDLRYSSEQILQFHNPGYDPEYCPDSWLPRQQPSFLVPGPPSSVWLFSRRALTPMNQLCPWRDSPSLLGVSSRWLPRPAVSSESLADQEWGLPSHWGACPLPPGLLLPGYLGPQ
ncbi:myotubularin-related protein 11-like, partial [Lontra canadensis]|uniref:myotubularin-related protein 11-like n=1 Tax=Lontra canadensis TaxID=76717 RepID=UPI0013F2CD98